MSSAVEAKSAMLRGLESQVSVNLGQLSTQLEIASELGVGPSSTPRDMRDITPASSVSPVTYTSPNVSSLQSQTMTPTLTVPVASAQLVQQAMMQGPQSVPLSADMSGGPTLTAMSMTTSVSPIPPPVPAPQQQQQPQQQAPQPGMLGVDPHSMAMAVDPAARPVTTTPTPATTFAPNGVPTPPPLVHSHSFPNGHMLPSQMHGSPSTPVMPSTGAFGQNLSIQHAPLISSPLASKPVSRAPSPPRPYPIPEQPWAESAVSASEPLGMGMARAASDMPQQVRRPSDGSSRADGRPIITRGRSTSVTKNRSMPSLTMSMPPSAIPSRAGTPEEEDEDDGESEDEAPRKNKRRRSSVGHEAPDLSNNNALISDDIRRQLDTIFDEFLNRVCSDLDFCDSKGEKLHQVLMPKKMQRLDESTDYRPFKFRIQAFTNAFQEELQSRGITEETMSIKKIKSYLWKQDLISRFNSDGKKAKSKGNHIWNVDAKKLPDGTWVFRPFKRRIINHPDAFV